MLPTDDLNANLRAELKLVLAPGMAQDPVGHARQVAEISGILHRAFAAAGYTMTLVGGSAIEIHAPGLYISGDMDVVLERTRNDARKRDEVFTSLGFRREGRHWRHARHLFIETVPGPVAGPSTEVRVGDSEFRVVTKEVVLRDRIVGFKHWEWTAFGEQAIDLLAAFGEDVDPEWLIPELEKEDALDAFHALRHLAESSAPVTDKSLRRLIDGLHTRGPLP